MYRRRPREFSIIAEPHYVHAVTSRVREIAGAIRRVESTG